MVLKTLGQKVKALTGEDRGVSPVIGVILMVAITVILAAVIGAFVLGLGDDLQNDPRAGVSVDDTQVTLTTLDNADGVAILNADGEVVAGSEDAILTNVGDRYDHNGNGANVVAFTGDASIDSNNNLVADQTAVIRSL